MGHVGRRLIHPLLDGSEGNLIAFGYHESADVKRFFMGGGGLSGRVLKAIRGHYWVETDRGTFHCYARESAIKSLKSATPIVVGDIVTLQVTDESKKEGVIVNLQPRRTKLSRKVFTGSREVEQIVAANIDHLVIVSSVAQPPLKPGLIDRYLVAAAKGDLAPIICINKIDLLPPVEARTGDRESAIAQNECRALLEQVSEVKTLYEQLGYPVILTSAKTGEGIDTLGELLRDSTAIFAGHSGVGKSSLLKALNPGMEVKVAEVNPRTGRGRHTTTAAELVPLPGGGYVIDTPGIRQFSLWDVTPTDVRRAFVEIARWSRQCRFNDCSHTVEPECAVREAVASGRIHPRRYETFLSLQQEIAPEQE